ncbi:MAG: MFS transporter [Candidatus Magnetoovum sp. WYHC-5]|nr:MFS transporter [Candidatus Magnetoovum sp. WYHC-5]
MIWAHGINKDFRRFFIAQAISFIGTWMHNMAQGWLVYSLTKSSLILGLTAMAQSLPILLFSLLGGVLADRYDKRKIIMLTQAIAIVPPILLYILKELDIVNIWHIMALSFLMGTVQALDIPVRQSFVTTVVGKDNILTAIAINSMAFHGARIVGPAIASAIIKTYDIAICFFINAITYLPIIYVLYKMKTHTPPAIPQTKGMCQDFKDGLRYIKDDKQMTFIMLTVSLFSLLALPFGHFLPVFADKIFKTDVGGLGYLMASMGVGALMAGLILILRGNVKNKVSYMTTTGLCFPIALILVSVTNNIFIACIFIAIIGWSSVSFLATTNSYLQLKSSDLLRGRIVSVFSLTFLGVMPFGYTILGTISEFLGIQKTTFLTATLSLIGFVVFNRKWKQNQLV